MKTKVILDHEPVADGGFLVRALLRITGDLPPDSDRVPLNLALVLDRSGSMSGPPLRAALEAAAQLVRRLRPEDTVSVVAYDNEVRVVAPPASGEAQESLRAAIAAISAGGSTNLSGGWLRGMELVAGCYRERGVNRILLLTDGLANQGITDRRTLIDLACSARERGIATTTIGFGARYDEDLLRKMADAGGGGTYYIERPDQASGVFEEELDGLLSLVAQNIRVVVRPGVDAAHSRVVHDYPHHANGSVLTLEVGDLYAREPRCVLMEFLLVPEAGMSGAASVAELNVTAQVLTARGVELETTRLPITLIPEEGGRVEPAVRREVLLQRAARARRDAEAAKAAGDLARGSTALNETASILDMNAGDDAELLEELADLRLMARRFARREVDARDVKYLKQRVYASARSRSLSKERFRRTSDE
jgi:Ca-activated chloride channel homolog